MLTCIKNQGKMLLFLHVNRGLLWEHYHDVHDILRCDKILLNPKNIQYLTISITQRGEIIELVIIFCGIL